MRRTLAVFFCILAAFMPLFAGGSSESSSDEVTLTVVRDGKEQEVKVTLGSDADAPEEEQDSSSGNGSGLSSEELRQYLEELLGGQGYGLGGNSIG